MGDDVWKSTRFNGNYMFNWLGGYEFKFGKKKVHSLAINTRIIWRGGNKYIPIDLAASQALGRQVDVEGEAFTQKLPDYFRWDASVLLKFNFNKWAFGISLDVQNVLNRKNINSYNFDPYINDIRTNYMFGIMPVFNFKFEF
jgi:outer membrane receptor protein involved in Fe transport